MTRSAIAVLLLVAATTVPAVAEEMEEIDGWRVSTRPQQAAAPASPLCVLASPIDGEQARFWLSNKIDERGGTVGDAVLQLVLDADNSLTAGESEAEINIAGQKSWNATGQISARDTGGVVVTFNLPSRIDETVRHIRRGAELAFDFGQDGELSREYKVSLKGSGRAGQAFVDCLAKVVPAI